MAGHLQTRTASEGFPHQSYLLIPRRRSTILRSEPAEGAVKAKDGALHSRPRPAETAVQSYGWQAITKPKRRRRAFHSRAISSFRAAPYFLRSEPAEGAVKAKDGALHSRPRPAETAVQSYGWQAIGARTLLGVAR